MSTPREIFELLIGLEQAAPIAQKAGEAIKALKRSAHDTGREVVAAAALTHASVPAMVGGGKVVDALLGNAKAYSAALTGKPAASASEAMASLATRVPAPPAPAAEKPDPQPDKLADEKLDRATAKLLDLANIAPNMADAVQRDVAKMLDEAGLAPRAKPAGDEFRFDPFPASPRASAAMASMADASGFWGEAGEKKTPAEFELEPSLKDAPQTKGPADASGYWTGPAKAAAELRQDRSGLWTDAKEQALDAQVLPQRSAFARLLDWMRGRRPEQAAAQQALPMPSEAAAALAKSLDENTQATKASTQEAAKGGHADGGKLSAGDKLTGGLGVGSLVAHAMGFHGVGAHLGRMSGLSAAAQGMTRLAMNRIVGTSPFASAAGSTQGGGGLFAGAAGAVRGLFGAGAGAAGGAAAGGAAAAGAAGGAAAGAGAAGAAAAGGPIGLVVAGVVLLGYAATKAAKALAEMPKRLEGWGESIMRQQERLQIFSGQIATAMSRLEFQQFRLDAASAGKTGATTAVAADALIDLKQQMQPWRDAGTNLNNLLAAGTMKFAAGFLQGLNNAPILKNILDALQNIAPTDEDNAFREHVRSLMTGRWGDYQPMNKRPGAADGGGFKPGRPWRDPRMGEE